MLPYMYLNLTLPYIITEDYRTPNAHLKIHLTQDYMHKLKLPLNHHYRSTLNYSYRYLTPQTSTTTTLFYH